MKKLSILLLLIILWTQGIQARDIVHKGDVVVVPLRGEISPSLLMFLRRGDRPAR